MPAWSAASVFCRSLPVCWGCSCCSEASPAPGCAKGADRSIRSDRTRNAVKGAFHQFGKQQTGRIDWTRHDRAPTRNALEAAFLVVSFVADQNDQAMAFVLRLLERAFDQGLPNAAIAKYRLNGDRTKQQRLGLADANGRKPDRADQQGPDARGERQFAQMLDLLAQPICGFRVTSRAERALVQALDRHRVVRRLGLDAGRYVIHPAAPSIPLR